jgi:hypothetical protein
MQTFPVQQVLLPHTLLRGINYFMAVDVVPTHRPSCQLTLFLQTIFRGSRLNWHVNYCVSRLNCLINYFVTVCVVATYIVSLHKVMLQRTIILC